MTRHTRLAILLLLALALPFSAGAQSLEEERSRVLPVSGRTVDRDLDLHPLGEGLGVVFSQPVSQAGAEALRIHFAVRSPDPGGATWGIRIRDRSGDVAWTAGAGDFIGGAIWSDEVAGDNVTVELVSARPGNTVEITIDRIATLDIASVPLSITGQNDLASIVGQDSWIVELGRSVARLRFVGDDGLSYFCTAFLITDELMLTNQHCISSQSEMLSTLVDFDFDRDSSKVSPRRLEELLVSDFGLDYSIVRLREPVGRQPLPVGLERQPDDEQLLIIQHPAGEPKQISLRDCEVDGPEVSGRTSQITDFGHQCDTKGGSSGSPIFHFTDRSVVGLHHLGINPASAQLFNRGVHLDLVLADIETRNPELLEEIRSGNDTL